MKVSPIIFWVVSTTIFSDEIHGFQYVSREEREQNFRQGSNVKPHPQPQQQKHRNLRRLHSSHSKSSHHKHHGHHGHNKGPGHDHHKAGPHPPHHPPYDPAIVEAPPFPPHHPHPFEGPPHPPHHPDLIDAPPLPPHPFGPHHSHSHSQDHIAHPHHHSLDFEGPPPEGHPPHPKDHFHSKPSHHNGHQHHPKNHHPFMDLFSGRKPGGPHPLMDKLNKGASLIKEEINHVKQEIDHFKESWESAMDELLDNLNMYEADVECASTSDCSAEPDCESFTLPEISDHFVLCASKNDEDFLTGIGLVVRQEGEGVDVVEDQTAEQEETLSSASADTQEVVGELIDTEEKEGEDAEESTAQVYCGKPTMEDCSNETDEEGNPCIWCTMNSWIGLCSSPRYEVMISEKMTCPNVGMS